MADGDLCAGRRGTAASQFAEDFDLQTVGLGVVVRVNASEVLSDGLAMLRGAVTPPKRSGSVKRSRGEFESFRAYRHVRELTSPIYTKPMSIFCTLIANRFL